MTILVFLLTLHPHAGAKGESDFFADIRSAICPHFVGLRCFADTEASILQFKQQKVFILSK